MTKSKTTHKAHAFSGAAALITAALLTAILFTACPNTAGSGTGGGTVPPAPGTYAQVPYDTLEDYLRDTASSEAVNYIEVTGTIPLEDFTGTYPNPGTLGQKLKNHSGKKVALKIKDYPAGLTDMRYCFLGCTSLTTVPNIPESVTNMSDCFRNCTSLTTAPAILAGVSNMNSCFSDCTSLTTVPAIPESVTDMSWCFSGCTKLTGVTLKCNYSAGNFDRTFENCTALQNGGIKVPAGALPEYQAGAFDMGTTAQKFAAITP